MEYGGEASRGPEARVLRSTARLKVSRSGIGPLTAMFGAAEARAVDGAGGADAAGWTEVDLDVEELPVAAGDILRLGLEAEGLGPPGLRAEVARSVTGPAQRYA
ncbi:MULTISPECIES: WYL domain-containing protein [Streptomyces]|nr:WYL domain-containing protein [Streptomyces sp. JCM 35825]UFQ20061.1 WYL domain-containing protein [Streptomyces huasconensis]WCL89680.1 WYL domain-containing protein [Streptomyces sp. JCM 35825]